MQWVWKLRELEALKAAEGKWGWYQLRKSNENKNRKWKHLRSSKLFGEVSKKKWTPEIVWKEYPIHINQKTTPLSSHIKYASHMLSLLLMVQKSSEILQSPPAIDETFWNNGGITPISQLVSHLQIPEPSTCNWDHGMPRYDLLLIHNDKRIDLAPGSFHWSRIRGSGCQWVVSFSAKKNATFFLLFKHPWSSMFLIIYIYNHFAILYFHHSLKRRKRKLAKATSPTWIFIHTYHILSPGQKRNCQRRERIISNNSSPWLKFLHWSFNRKYHTKQFPSFWS